MTRVRPLFRCLVALLALTAALPALAQSGAASAEARAAQFVFVIDDSGSMQQTDPNRLAIFAVKSLLAMLDGRDEVSIVRLNGAVEGEAPPPIEPLSRNRSTLERLLDGELASYAGEDTTCRSALRSARRQLDAAYRPNVAQVVLFLTDGECTPDTERPEPAELLQGLRSHQEGLFQLYVVRFQGKRLSPQLPELARVTGGDTIEVGAADATAILHAFAMALSRSQGYAAELLSPQDPEVKAHRGARRVRLLAVTRGEKPQLGFSIRDGQGRAPRAVGQPRDGVHRYGTGQPFRYVALDYRPDIAPMTVQVTGAGNDWKAVALPEYRLFLRTEVFQGACGQGERPVKQVVETGSTVCFQADLKDEGGTTVDGNLTGRELEAELLIRRAGEPASAAKPIPMEPVGQKARFRLERGYLEKGDWLFQPVINLQLAGPDTKLRGPMRYFQVGSIEISTEPASFDFKTLLPGQEVSQSFKLQGNFPRTKAHVELLDRRDVPSCVTFELNGRPEGKPEPLSVGVGNRLTLRVAPYCGPKPFREARKTHRLLLVFEGLAQREVPVTFGLDYDIHVPPEVSLSVDGGDERERLVPILGNHQKDLSLQASVIAGGGWPEDHLRLVLGDRGKVRVGRGEDGGPQVRAEAHPCCTGGSHRAELRLAPASLDGYAPGAEPPAPLILPVRIEVREAGIWACYGYWILRGLAALLLLALLAYGVNIFRNSHFLKPARLAEKLIPLVWTAQGGTVEPKDHKAKVLEMVRQSIPWHKRLTAWTKANPLAVGLPGRVYHESLELLLQPHRDVSRSTALLVPRRAFPDAVSRDPETFTGKLFATTQGGLSFLAVPDKEGRIGRLTLDGGVAYRAASGDPARNGLVRLRGSKLLRRPEDWEPPEDGRPAGWQVG